MPTLAGQRAQFTWALNQYNQAEDPDDRARFAKTMAKYLAAAPSYGATPEDLIQGRSYPAEEVSKYLGDPTTAEAPGVSEEQALTLLAAAVDASAVVRLGTGAGVVYAYGYRCAPDRLKIGSTQNDAVQRIAAQINTSTPDRPTLYLEMRTDSCRALERALHRVLEVRGGKVEGAGAEWFKTTTEEVIEIYKFVVQSSE
jgi:hypothetical protein